MLRSNAKEFVPGTPGQKSKIQTTKLSAKASAFVPKASPTTVPASPKFEVNKDVNKFELNGVSKSKSKVKTETNGFPDEPKENTSKPPVKDRLRASGPILPRNSKPIPITNAVDDDEPLKVSIPKAKKRSESFEEAEAGAEAALESSVRKYTRDEIMSLRKGSSVREKEIMDAISSVLGKSATATSPRTRSPDRRGGRGGKRDGRDGPGRRNGGGRGKGYEEMDIGEVKDLEKSENRYVVKKEVPPDEKLIRDLTATLNKLTPEKFEKLLNQVMEMNINTPEKLRDTVHAVFEKALAQPAFSPTYAEFSVALSAKLQRFDDQEEVVTFKRLLLNKCQLEFEKETPRTPTETPTPTPSESGGEDTPTKTKTSEEIQDIWAKTKRRMLATIQFIGELYARKLLNTSIMKQCIEVLLGKSENPEEEKLEALCKLLSTIGKTIDVPKNVDVVSGPFETLKVLSKKKEISSRIRFMIQDILDLREAKWVDRRAKQVVQKKLSDIHKESAASQKDSSSGSRTPRSTGTPRSSSPRSTPRSSTGGTYVPSPRARPRGIGGTSSGQGTPTSRTPKSVPRSVVNKKKKKNSDDDDNEDEDKNNKDTEDEEDGDEDEKKKENSNDSDEDKEKEDEDDEESTKDSQTEEDDTWEVAGSNTRKGRKSEQHIPRGGGSKIKQNNKLSSASSSSRTSRMSLPARPSNDTNSKKKEK